jgi:hypothetical protein
MSEPNYVVSGDTVMATLDTNGARAGSLFEFEARLTRLNGKDKGVITRNVKIIKIVKPVTRRAGKS